jgi:hypothetical protein
LSNGQPLLGEEVEVKPLIERRWIERRGGSGTIHGRQGKVKMWRLQRFSSDKVLGGETRGSSALPLSPLVVALVWRSGGQ